MGSEDSETVDLMFRGAEEELTCEHIVLSPLTTDVSQCNLRSTHGAMGDYGLRPNGAKVRFTSKYSYWYLI